MTSPSFVPLPGSPEARQRGCTCPPQRFPTSRDGAYIVNRTCRLHYREHASDNHPARHTWRERLPSWIPTSRHSDLVPRRVYEDENEYESSLVASDAALVYSTDPFVAPPYIWHDEPCSVGLSHASASRVDAPPFTMPQIDIPHELPHVDFPSLQNVSDSLASTLNNASDAMSHIGDSLAGIGSGGGSGGFSDSSPASYDTSSTSSVDTSSAYSDSGSISTS
jgi:hypothetical protein